MAIAGPMMAWRESHLRTEAEAAKGQLTQQLHVSRRLRLAAQARADARVTPIRSLLLAAEAVDGSPDSLTSVPPVAVETLLNLSAAIGGDLVTQLGIYDLQVSSDGKWLASGGDKSVRLWRLARTSLLNCTLN